MNSYRGLRIWDGSSDHYLDETSLAIESGRIVDVGTSYGKARDFNGLTVIPGLIDAHVHMTLDPAIADVEKQLSQSDDEIRRKMPSRAEAMVRCGVTTARDLGGGNWLELELRDRINIGAIPGPRLLCAGQPVTCNEGHCHFWGGVANSKTEIRSVIERQHDHGVNLIKMMATGGNYTRISHPGRAQFSQQHMSTIVATAKALDYPVAAHCHGTEGIERAVKAGVTTVEHCSWLNRDGKRAECDVDTIELMGASEVWVSPTINSGWARFGKQGDFKIKLQENFRQMKQANVRLIASTDAGIPNVRHDDLPKALSVFAEYAELTPVEALRTATSEAARALGLSNEVGLVRSGHSADLIFVEGDPLQDLSVLDNPVLVIAQGKEYES